MFRAEKWSGFVMWICRDFTIRDLPKIPAFGQLKKTFRILSFVMLFDLVNDEKKKNKNKKEPKEKKNVNRQASWARKLVDVWFILCFVMFDLTEKWKTIWNILFCWFLFNGFLCWFCHYKFDHQWFHPFQFFCSTLCATHHCGFGVFHFISSFFLHSFIDIWFIFMLVLRFTQSLQTYCATKQCTEWTKPTLNIL